MANYPCYSFLSGALLCVVQSEVSLVHILQSAQHFVENAVRQRDKNIFNSVWIIMRFVLIMIVSLRYF